MSTPPDYGRFILEALRATSDHVSGEWLAQELKISRQGLWKHIDKLQKQGYQIVAVPHLGYRLAAAPDKLYPYEIYPLLKAGTIGSEIHYYDTVDSTQDICMHLGAHGAGEGVMVVSEAQERGRGRLGRSWVSSLGGIYFSLLLRPSFLTLMDAPKINFLVSLAVVQAIEQVAGVKCGLKWPNDIFLANKKLGGILCEVSAQIDKVDFIVVGVGVNINNRDLPARATSLFLVAKKKYSRAAVLAAILDRIEILYEQARKKGFMQILEAWKTGCMLWGKEVEVKVLERVIKGKAAGLDDQGCLLVKHANRTEKISSGDVTRVNG